MRVRMTCVESIRADKTITSLSAVRVPQGCLLQLLTSQLPGEGRRQPANRHSGQPNLDPAPVWAELATSTHFLRAPFPAPTETWKSSFPSGQTGRGHHIGPSELLPLAHLNFSGLLSDSYSEFPKISTLMVSEFSNGSFVLSWCQRIMVYTDQDFREILLKPSILWMENWGPEKKKPLGPSS